MHLEDAAKPSLCFVSPKAYFLIAGETERGHIGGAEVQQVLIARELARRGHHISFVTHDYGQADAIEHDGIRVFKMCAPDAGLPGLRFVHPRWTSLCNAMARADADVYYQRAGGVETGQAALWCRRHGRNFVYAVASEPECRLSPIQYRGLREGILFGHGLKSADRILAQSPAQQEMVRQTHRRDASVIFSCARDPEPAQRDFPSEEPRSLVWLGRIIPCKRLECVLDLAEALPELQIEIVGDGSRDSDYVRDIIQRAGIIPNVVFHGRVPYSDVHRFYRRCLALLCTSSREGFPNTFVEAWSWGIPVATLWDGTGLVRTHDLGIVATNVQELADGVRRTFLAPLQWEARSRRVRDFYLQHHTIQRAAEQYAQLLTELTTS